MNFGSDGVNLSAGLMCKPKRSILCIKIIQPVVGFFISEAGSLFLAAEWDRLLSGSFKLSSLLHFQKNRIFCF
jgi:hypothetical protein